MRCTKVSMNDGTRITIQGHGNCARTVRSLLAVARKIHSMDCANHVINCSTRMRIGC